MKISRLVFFVLIWFTFCSITFSQNNESFYQKIHDIGMNYIAPLKSGKIENLKNVTPPKDTWNYSNLLIYKNALKNEKASITYGNYIEESVTSKGIYAFNFFALGKSHLEPYFFASVISIDTNQTPFKIENTYLFTEKTSLKDWWQHAYGFYQSKYIKNIPIKFLYPIPPPPPFKP